MDASSPAVRVWDPLVRLCHWILASSVVLAWATREGGGRWHEGAGYAVLLCVGLRLAWGWVGPGPARFAHFVRSPAVTLRYARFLLARSEPRYLGHNPLGGWMIVALLTVAAIAGGSGWLYVTDAFWGEAWVERLHFVSAVLLLALAAVHVAGVITTSIRQRENLAGAMVHGRKRPPGVDDIAA